MKLAIFLAEGFEETEAIATIDVIRRANIKIDIISIGNSLEVIGGHNIVLKSDILLDKIDTTNKYDGFILPGGGLGVENLNKNSKLPEILNNANKNKKMIAAICAAPQILGKLEIIKNQNITNFPGAIKNLSNAKKHDELPAVKDQNIITGASIGCAIKFALLIVEYFLGVEKRNKLEKTLVIR